MKSSQLLRILKRDGWIIVSQEDSHIKMTHATRKGIVFIPYHGSKEVATGTDINILKSAVLK